MKAIMQGASRFAFLVGGVFLAVGMHRVIFGVRPKLVWVRDLPWERVNAPLCFAAALGLAGLGAWLGRRSLVATPAESTEAGDARARELSSGRVPDWGTERDLSTRPPNVATGARRQR